MSKRILTIVLATAISMASSNAFASRARLIVMGTGDAGILGNGVSAASSGSFYYDDAYNIFFNPSYVNDFKNWGTIEKSNFAGTSGNSGQGGFVASFMNFNVGFYANRMEGVYGLYNDAVASNTLRPWEIMIGSDMGVKWGVGASFGSRKYSPGAGLDKQTDSDIVLKAGVQIMDFEPFVHFKLKGDDTSSTGVVAGSPNKNKSLVAGVKYKMGEWSPYFAVRQDKYTVTATDTSFKTQSNWGLGVGRNTKLGENAMMRYAIGYWRTGTSSVTGASAGVMSHNTIVPINFSLEGDPAGWVTLRAGLTYDLINQNDATGTNANNTTARVGATVHAGKADIDFALGTQTLATATATNTEAGAPYDTQVFGLGSGFITATAISYKW